MWGVRKQTLFFMYRHFPISVCSGGAMGQERHLIRYISDNLRIVYVYVDVSIL